MNKLTIGLVAALTLLATLIMPAAPVSAANSGCKPNERAFSGNHPVTKTWDKPSGTNNLGTYAGIRFVSYVTYTRCTTPTSSRVIVKSAKVVWSAIHRKVAPTWSCSIAGGVQKITINPDSIAGTDYGNVTKSCASHGTFSLPFADRVYNGTARSNPRCMGVKVTVHLSYRDDQTFMMPQNCI